MTKLFYYLLLVLLLSCVSCNLFEADYHGVIKGNAFLTVNATYGDSVFADNQNIKVTLISKDKNRVNTFTDFNGNYILNNVKQGEYMLRFEKKGFTYFELYNINHNGTDTLDYTIHKTSSNAVKLVKYFPLEWSFANDLWIGYYYGSINQGPNAPHCGKNYQIITEIKSSRPMVCIAFIDNKKEVECLHYKQAFYIGSFGRQGIPNPIMPIDLSKIDLKEFSPGSIIYIHYYPCISGKNGVDPWLGVTKYFDLIQGTNKIKDFKLPGDTMYYVGSIGCN